ncbi:cadherin domain-containing protein [Limnohabitans sp. MMS-10A-192]|uniref:cadherin domain-containing protein n=1 Tax=Limnohabitans sp. MMS-10A-192 TaxID=1835769 RepID=UPI000D34F139|nr:cadherin domain-containing protein [Limnohabitans sp. MMS-10A-192]
MSAVNTQILFIDSRVANIDSLLAQVDPGYEVVMLNSEEAGLTQIANALQGRTGVDVLHVLSHGGSGYLSLGNGALNIDRLGFSYNLDALTTIANALSADADILLYGCDVAAGDAGRAFIDALAIATGADVAASSDVTGASYLGGDWVLEAASGEINTTSMEFQGYEQTLGASVSYSFSGASGSYSRDAIMTATGVTYKSGGTLKVTGYDVDFDQGERDALYISYNNGGSWTALINTYGDKYLRGYNNQSFVTTYNIPNFEFMQGTTLLLKVDGEVNGWLFSTSATTLSVFTNIKPNAASNSVSLDEDGRYTFSSGLFGFNDSDNDGFVKLRITSLPDSGTLTLNGSNVSSGQEIAAGSLSGLRYTPVANYYGQTSFGFQVFDGYEWSANAYTMTAVVNSVNDAPSLSNSVVLMPMTEDQVSNPGVTLIGRLGSYFNDIESGAGNMAGVVITGTDADPSTEGTWEYYAGGAWHAIDTAAVSATNALALSYSTLIRFNPVADYNGTPSALKLLATDGSFNTLLYATGAPAGGNYVNTLTAAATAGISAVERTVGIIVLPTNDAPEFSPSETITGGVQDTYVRDTAGTLVLSTGTGSAVSGQTLRGTVVATDAESSASQLEYSIRGGLETSANMWQLQGLYGLLTFNASTKTWVYTPNRLEAINALPEGASVNDRFDLKVVDPDGAGALRALDITITGTNDVPRLNAAIENPATFNGAGEWSFQIPANTFVDAEGLGLSYDAKLENGDPLPLWLDFNPLTRTFSGNPTASEQSSTLNVRVYAQDTGVNSQALIDVANDAAADAAQTFSIQIGSITVTVPSVDVAAATTGVGLAQAIEAAIQATPGLSTVTVSYANGVLTITDPDKREITNASLSNGATQIDASIQYINATISDVFTLTLGNNLNDAPTGGVSITGTLAQNSTLTADASSLLDADGLGALTYTWYANGVQVQAGSGAGSDELALTQSHVGKSISVKVSYQDQGGANEAVFSTQTARVANVNDAPALTGTQATLADGVEDRTYIVRTKDLVAGFTDADGDTLSVTGLTKTINSNVTPVTANADGTYSITLPANFNGTVTLNYSVTDGTATTTGASRTFTVDPVNDAPTGSASATLPDAQKNVAYTVTKAQLLQGFSDVDGDALSIQSLRANEFAVVTANGNDTWTITPATNDTGLVTLSYDVIDGNGGRVSATQTYTIKNSTALNFTPLFNADVVWGDDDAAAVTPTANFDDNYAFVSESVATSEGNPGDGLPDDGVFAADSTHPYVDLANFNEAGNNAWRVTGQGVSVDGVQTSGASLNTATINIVNGQYSEVHLFASAGGAGVGSNATFEVTLTYTDASTETSDLLSVPDWYDNDLLPTNVYRLIDEMDRAAIPSGWMGQYDYDAVNDPAIFGFKVVADSSKTLASVTISVVENQTTAFAFFGGTAVSTDTATAVNLDMPVATLGTANAAEGQTITVDLSTLVTDPDTPLANLTFSGAGVSGNTLIFTAPMDANKSGTEVVTRSYTVTDGNTTITGYVDITVDYGNTPPASTDTTTTAARGQAIVLSLSDFGDFTDAENGPFNYVIITALPSSGTLTLNNGSIDVDMAGLTFANDMQATYPGTNPLPNGVLGYWIPTADIVAGKLKYTADANETNTAITGLQFYVEENPISTSPNTVTFQLSNAAPALTDATLAAADLSGTEDTTQTISTADLTQGYTDADGNTLSVTNISASSGTIVDDGVGGFTYVPALNDNGPVTLTYDIVDGVNGVVSGVTRTLNIAAVNDPVSVDAPLANMTGTPGAPLNIDIDLLSPFYDPDAGDTLTYSATANDQPLSFYGLSIDPTTGVISGNAPGSEPYLNFVITGTDAVGTSATSSFTLDLSGGSSSTPNQQYGLTANNPGAVTYTGTPTQGHDLIAQLPTDIDGMTAVLATSVTVTQQGDALASPAPLSEIVSVAFGNKPAGVKSMTFAGVTVDLSAASTPQQVAAAVVTALNGNATWTAVNNNNGSITLTSVTPANQADLQTSSFTGDVGVTYQWQKAPVVSGAQVVTVAVTTLPGGAQGEEVLVTFNASKPNGVSGVAFDGVGIDLTNASTAAEMAAAVTNAINANPAIANWTAIDNGNGTIKLIADTIGHRDDLSTVAVNLGTDPVTLPSFVPLGAWTDVVGTGGYGTTQTLNILQQSESENFVRVQAFYTDAAGVAETPISNVKFVADANDTGTVSISGTAAPGYTLTAILEDADGISSSNPTYQWQSSSSPTGPWGNISGATSSTYTVQTTDANKYLRVNVVSYTDNGGYTQANTASDDVGPIQLGNVAPVAVDDTVTITEHSGDQNGTIDTVSPYSGDLLANDSDANGNGTMSINEVRFGATVGAGTLATDNGTTLTYIGTYGTLTVTKSSGEYTYELDQDNADVQALLPGQQLIEEFNYRVVDTGGLTDRGVLTIYIDGENDLPTVTGVIPASITVDEDVPVLLDLSNAVIDIVDVDGPTVTLKLAVTNGTLRVDTNSGALTVSGYDTNTLTITANSSTDLMNWLAVNDVYYVTGANQNQAVGNYDTLTYSTSDDGGTNYIIQGTTDIVADAVNDALIVDAGGGYVVEGSATVAALATAVTITQQGDAAALPAVPEIVDVTFLAKPANINVLTFAGLTIDLTASTTAMEVATAVVAALVGNADWTAVNNNNGSITLTSVLEQNVADLQLADFQGTVNEIVDILLLPVPATAANPTPLTFDGFTLDLEPGMTIQQIGALFENASFPNWVASINDDGTLRLLAKNQGALDNLNALSFTNNGVASPYVVTSAGNNNVVTFKPRGDAVEIAPKLTVTDVDSGDVSSATVTLVTGVRDNQFGTIYETLSLSQAGQDLADFHGITVLSQPSSSGFVLTLNAPAGGLSSSIYESLLREVLYENSNPNAFAGDRTVQISLSDINGLASNTASISTTEPVAGVLPGQRIFINGADTGAVVTEVLDSMHFVASRSLSLQAGQDLAFYDTVNTPLSGNTTATAVVAGPVVSTVTVRVPWTPVVDNSGTLNTLTNPIGDFDAVGRQYTISYVEQTSAVRIAFDDASITDQGGLIRELKVDLTNPVDNELNGPIKEYLTAPDAAATAYLLTRGIVVTGNGSGVNNLDEATVITFTAANGADATYFQYGLRRVGYVNNDDAMDTRPTPDRTIEVSAIDVDGNTSLNADGTLSVAAKTIINLTPVNDAPNAENSQVTATEDTEFTFTAPDFGFNDNTDVGTGIPGNSLAAIRIDTLPTHGVLKLDGVDVEAGDEIAVANIGNLTYTPDPEDNDNLSAVSFEFSVQDDGDTFNSGQDWSAAGATMTVNITPVNDAPVNTVPDTTVTALPTDEDTGLDITGLQIADLDADEAGVATVTVTLSVDHGELSVAGTGGASGVTAIYSNSDSTVELTGSVADINAVLAATGAVTYLGNQDYNGSDTLTMVTDDGGNTGAVYVALSDTDTVAITINPINDAPVLDTNTAVAVVSTIDEDVADAANVGTTVAALIGAGWITDVDLPGAEPEAMAITAVDNTNGTWQYKLSGGSWADIDVTKLDNDEALLLGRAALVRFVPEANYNGTVTQGLTFRAWDETVGVEGDYLDVALGANIGGIETLSADTATAEIIVNAVNDAPVNTVPDTTVTALPTDEDTGLDITGLQIADLDADEAGVATVTVTLSVDHGELSVAGTGGASGVTAIYSNSDSTVELTGSVADINAVLAATGAVTYLGNQDYNGSDTLTMVTDDGGNTGAVYVALSDTDTVAITINPINDAPVLDTNTAVAVVSTIDEDVADAANVGTTVAALIGAGWITDVDLPGAEPEAMAITAVDNTNGTWQYKLSGGSWADIDVTKLDNDEALLLGRAALVRFVPEANYNGTVTQGLTFRAWDETVGVEGDYLDVASGANIGGIETLSADTAIAEITVNAVNDAPVNTVPADQTVDEDTGLDITGLQIADLDADETVGATVTVTLSVLNGEITVAGTGGAVTAASNGSSSVELTGSVTDINAVLAAAGAVTYQGNQDHNGSDTLTMVTDDGGNTGAVYVALSDTDTVAITINPINDAPVVDLNGGAGGNDNTSGVAFNPRGTAVAIIDPQLTGTLLSDVDTGDVLTEMVVSISEGLRDNLSITYETLDLASGYQLPAGITVVGLGTTTLTFSSTAGDSHANFEEVLRAITYNNTNPNATAGTRTITVSVTDQGDPAGEGAATPLTATATTAVQVNWGAVVDLNGADQAERDFYVNPYTEETGAVFVTDSDAQIVDQDGNIRSVTVTLANPLDNVVDALNPLVTLYQEYLTISSMASVTAAGISVTGNGTGTDGLIDATELTFTALNLAIGYVGIDAGQGLDGTYFQLATRTVQYTNTSQDPDPTMREVVFTSRDMDTTFDPDGNPGVSATTYINVTPVNDLPTIAVGANDGVTGDQTEGVNGDGQALTATDTITVTDVDYTQSLDASVLSVSTTGPVGSLLEADLLAMMAVSPTSVLTASGAGSNRTAAVTWAFDSGAEPFDYLKSTDTLTLTYTVRVTDSESGTADETVTITLTGQNDAPTVLDVLSTSADEGDVSYDVNMLDGASDLDRDETATLSVVASSLSYTIDGGASTPGLPAGLDIITGNTLSVDSEDAAFDDLATGEQRVIVVSYDIEDDTGATVAQTLTVTLTGTNDAPVISVATNDSDVGGETETDGALQITGTLTVNDVDFTDNVTTTVTSVVTSGITTGLATLSEANLLGMLSIQSNDTNAANAGTANNLDWEFDSAAVTAFDYLQDGQRVTLTYTVTSTDDDTAEAFDTHTIAITITGTNDGIVVTGTPVLSADLDELDAPAVGAELTAFGTIEFTDLDLADEHVVTTSVPVGTVGGALTNVEIVTDTTGTGTGGELRWDYAVSAASVEYLGVGDTQVDTFEVTFSDQNGDTETRQIVVTINGTNDAPTITAAQSAGGVTERADAALDELTATLTDQGTIEFADVDLTDTHTATVDTVVLDDQGNEVALPIGALTLGAVDPINKEVQWTFSAFDSELDNLSEGQTLTQVYTITIDDGETGGTVTQEVTITLYGTNDRPAITVTATGDVTEEDSTADLTDSGAVSVVDPDDLDVQTITTEVVSTAWDDATLSASYTLSAEQEAALTSGFTADQTGWNYQVANDDVQFLGANETVTLTFSVSTQDDSGATNDTDTQNVIITVNGVNDRPSAISDSGGLVINEVVGAGALNPSWRTITTLSAVDADQNDSFTYEVVGGADAAFFRFNPSNAAQLQLTPAAPLDTEVRSSYTVTVRATDQHGESVDRTLTIVIADRDEFDVTRPTFDVNNTFEGLLPNTFPEGEYGITPTQTVGTLLGVKAVAVDADATTNTVSYSLTGNELGTVPYSSGEFYINASTGDISVIAPIDYETGGDTRTVYVKATSADGSSAISALRLVVVNVDEEAPTFTSGDVVASQDENIADGTEVYDADAFDTDFNAPNTSSSFTYSLDGTDAGAFSIDANGVVTINSSPNYETQSSYSFEVVAEDAAGNISRKSLTLTIDNLNDNPVVGPDDTDTAADEVDEDASIGAVVGVTAFASDADAGGQAITYSLSDDAGGLFAIDENTGVVTVLGALDYETAQSHDITVVATSADGSVESGMVTIAVGNVNDNMPVATPPAAVDLAEDAAAGDIAGAVVTATDADGTLNALTFSLVGGPTDGSDNDLFEIDPTTGQISLTTAGAAFIDFESTESYTLDVEVTDGANTSTAVQVTVNLVNVNDNTPVATPPAAVDLAEDAAAGDIAGAVVTATDADGTLNPLTFSLVNAPIDGLGNDLFAIDPVTGQISLTDEGAASIDYESADQSYTLDVEASDGTNASTTQVTINLTDVNDNPVVGPDDVDAAADAVDEDAAVGAVVGVTALASDADAGGQTITYSLSNNPGGLFAINEETGVVTVALALDYETAQSHEITVLATSADGSSESGTVTIAVGNVNDNMPVATPPAAVDLAEDAAAGDIAGAVVTATDADGTLNALTFSLVGGPTDGSDNDLFEIDPTTGQISLTTAGAAFIDFESTESYTLDVEVTDGANTSTAVQVTVNLVNVNDNTPVATPPAAVDLAEDAAAGDIAGAVVTATDEDGTLNPLTFSLVNAPTDGLGNDLFAIDPVTGQISLTAEGAASIDYESADQSYTLDVEASDGTNASTTQVTINLTDVNDNPVVGPDDVDAAADAVDEDAAVGAVVGVTALASDADAGGQTITYSLSNNPGGLFAINEETGVVTVALALDYETAQSHEITVLATSADGSSESGTVTIAVGNVNDNDVMGPHDTDVSDNNVNENVEVGTVVSGLAITASDLDEGGQTITYSLTNDAGGKFAIDSQTGVVTVAGALNYEAEEGPSYTITVEALSADGSVNLEDFTIGVNNMDDQPTGEVIINGAPVQGRELTVTHATLADEDGINTGRGYYYQWFAGTEPIAAANGATLTLGQEQVGKLISVVVRYTDNLGNTNSLSSLQTTRNGSDTVPSLVSNVNDAPTGLPVISGALVQGQTLTASVGTLADLDGLGELSYAWFAGSDAISGATGNTFVLTQDQVGKSITVRASYTDQLGAPEQMISAQSVAVSNVNDLPAGEVTISGTVTQGQTLTAANNLVDVDGMGTVTYQWLANGQSITGATSSTLTLGQDQVGKAITVRAAYTDLRGTNEAVTSTGTAAVANVNDVPTGAITISGTPTQNQTLTVINTLADVDGLGEMSYQWKANGEAISGQTGATLVLGQAQVGKAITVTASYADGQSTPETVTSTATASVANVNDVPTGTVTITGTATQGQTLTAANTLADVDGLGEISYQWKANGEAISGQTGATLVLGQTLVGKAITVTASYTDGQTTAEAVTSNATTSVLNVNDVPTGAVTITGTATQGQTLTAANTLADVDGMGVVSYQWKADGEAISGQTGSTLVLGQTLVGKAITVTASYTDGQSTAEAVTSNATASVLNVNDVPTGAITISGTPTQNQTLTVINTLADVDGLGAMSYQWKANGEAISGQTGATLVLGQAQVGKAITVTASYADGQSTPETVTSTATASVGNVNDAPTGAVTITGKATLGQTLTATSTLADSDGLGVLSYQWKANGEAISGQTGTTLELGQAQVGKAITVTASYTDGYITAESATSIATAAVDTVTIAKLTAFDRVTAMNSLVGAAGTGTAIYGIEAHDQQGTNLAFSLAGAVNVSGKTINDYLQLVEDDANNKATVYLRSGVSLQSLINALGGLDFSITVQDGGLTVIDPLTSVSIGGPGSDILYVASNNTAPVLSSSSNGDLIDNSGVVYQATATDTTGYGMFNYSLSGADAAFFDIDATTGAVTVKSGLTDLQTADFLTRSSYNIDVVVKDGVLGGQQSTTQSVTLNRPEVDKVGGLTVVATEANHTTNNNNAVVDVTNTAVAPNQLAAGMDLPYGKSLITATQEVDQGLVPTNISLYVDKNAGVNGFWTTINGSLVNLATAEFGGSMTEVGSQLRIDLKIDDAFDLAHSSNFVDNGVVTLNGAAAKIDLGALGANPLQANDLFWS